VNIRAAAPAAARSDGPEGDAALAQEMQQLELGLLEDEVKLLREQVSGALKDKVQYETSPSRTDPKASEDAELAYIKAREVYLRKAYDLASVRRRLGKVEEPPKAEPRASGDAAPGEDRAGSRKSGGSGSHASGAAVGSIDLEAVLKQYARVRRIHERLNADRAEANERFAKHQTEADAIASRMGRLQPGGADDRVQEEKLKALKRRHEVEREVFEQEFTRRQARESASVLEDVQEVIAAAAKDKGLDYVVKVDPGPQPDATPVNVHAAFNRSVLYANPRNDITEEVIRELNRRFESAGDRGPR
jgi:Skp family chaperone for outer membrane proteins